ncbi:MAG: Flagellar motor switch protein FliG [bacterium]|nr:Flagellar motor switch protein FliG [bacterium]
MPLRGRTKAAIFLLFVGREVASAIYPHLSEAEIEDLTMEIANLGPVSPDVADEVLADFWHAGMASQFISSGDVEFARGILSEAFGDDRASEIIQRLSNFLQVTPFDFIRRTDASNLINFLHNEHPQTIALILAYLHPTQSGELLSKLPPEMQADVARRMALMERTSPEVIREVERVLEKNLSGIISQVFTSAGGLDALVNILNLVDRTTERSILEILEQDDPQLAAEIKNRMFIFEDIVQLDDRSIQQILREVDSKLLGLALRGVNEDVSGKIYRNMSKRAAAMLKEDMEFSGPVRVKDVEGAQQQIVAIIRALEESGDIIMGRGEGDKLI